MDDTISRKAAIDAIEQCKTARASDGEIYVAKINALMKIDALPTAQPEIIHCKDCKWWEKQKDSLQGRCELMQMYPTGAWYCGNARRIETPRTVTAK